MFLHVDSDLPVIAVEPTSQPVDKSAALTTLESAHHSTIAHYLRALTPVEIGSVGTALGLEYSRLMNLESLDGMVHAWLRRDDNAKDPTWHSLVTALESLGHNGIASSIKKS